MLSGVCWSSVRDQQKINTPCHLPHPPPLHKPRWERRWWQWWSWYSFRRGRWERRGRRRGRRGEGGRGGDFSPGLVRMGEPVRYPASHYCGANVFVFLPSDWQAWYKIAPLKKVGLLEGRRRRRRWGEGAREGGKGSASAQGEVPFTHIWYIYQPKYFEWMRCEVDGNKTFLLISCLSPHPPFSSRNFR